MDKTTESSSHALARIVAEALKAAGVTQQEASQRSGIASTTLTRRLTGNSPFTVTELSALAALANVTASELFARAEAGEAA